jgi:hypothetical protein
MNKAVPVILATLALAGCMTSYPLWDPDQVPVEAGAPLERVTIEGRVAEIDHDEGSIEIETTAEGDDSWVRVDFDDETVVYTSGARDESAEGDEGIELLEEDDLVTVSGTRENDDTVMAREISLVGSEVSAMPRRPDPSLEFQPRDRVPGVVRSVDTERGRIVLDTVEHGMIAVFCDGDTPVFFHGGIFRITNLEVGDGVIVTIGATDDGDPAAPWVTAIEVTRSVSHDGPAPAAQGPVVPALPPANRLLDVLEIEGTVKRAESQGFEIEAADGELRWVTADPQMMVTGAGVRSAGEIRPGARIRVRLFEIGNRLVAQRITLVN